MGVGIFNNGEGTSDKGKNFHIKYVFFIFFILISFLCFSSLKSLFSFSYIYFHISILCVMFLFSEICKCWFFFPFHLSLSSYFFIQIFFILYYLLISLYCMSYEINSSWKEKEKLIPDEDTQWVYRRHSQGVWIPFIIEICMGKISDSL